MGSVKRVGLLSSVLMLVMGLSACEKPAAPEVSIRPALVMTVNPIDFQSKFSIVGEIKPRYAAVQGFRVPGKITKRYVDVGETVKKGQRIARIDAADANLSVQADQAAITAAQANLDFAASELKRQQQLLDKQFISPAALDRYQTSYHMAKASFDQAKAKSAVTRNQSAYTHLYADRSGVINQINAEPGQVVAAGEPVVTIISPNDLEVHIPVAEANISQVKLKQAVKVKLWSNGSEYYQARVREIAPVADTVTRTYLVKLKLKNVDDKVKMGMTATAILPVAQTEQLMIPTAAVIQQEQQAIVWEVDDQNQVHAKPVRVAAYDENGAIVADGLQAGDKIVIAGAHVLTENQQIQPVERKR